MKKKSKEIYGPVDDKWQASDWPEGKYTRLDKSGFVFIIGTCDGLTGAFWLEHPQQPWMAHFSGGALSCYERTKFDQETSN